MVLNDPGNELQEVVSRGGLEPPTRCLRGSCSTIELPAHEPPIVTREVVAPNFIAPAGSDIFQNKLRKPGVSPRRRNTFFVGIRASGWPHLGLVA